MRCNPSRWLWGLIPVAMLSWGTYYRERPSIEADLTVRATEALDAAGQSWARVAMAGRDAVITGRAQKDGDPKAALDIVRGVWGIRTVQLKTDLAGQPAAPERIGPPVPAPDDAAIAAAKAKEDAQAAAALKAKEEAEAAAAARAQEDAAAKAREEAAAARKAEEDAAAKAREEAEAAAALRAKEEADAAAALAAKEAAEAAAAQRAREQTAEAMRAQAEAEAVLRAEEEAAVSKAKDGDEAAAAAQRAKEEAEAAAALKAKEEAEAAARKAEEEAAAAKAREEAEAAAREAEARAAQKAKQDADMEAEAKADAERQKAAEEEAKRAARKTTAETEACERKLSAAVSEGVILFDRASADIDRKSARTLKRLSEIVKTCPGARVEVEGHTDSEGTDERNQNLSERRARAVVGELVKAGVSEDRLSAVGFGATRPVASNDTKAGMAKNRRIEFKVFTD